MFAISLGYSWKYSGFLIVITYGIRYNVGSDETNPATRKDRTMRRELHSAGCPVAIPSFQSRYSNHDFDACRCQAFVTGGTTATVNLMTTVIGRNGYAYDALHIGGDLYIVGKHVVRVEHGELDSRVVETVCKATKAGISRHMTRLEHEYGFCNTH